MASPNRIDPFWDKVIVAANTVAVYPLQEITVEEADGRCARVWYNSREVVTIETWIKEREVERSDEVAQDGTS